MRRSVVRTRRTAIAVAITTLLTPQLRAEQETQNKPATTAQAAQPRRTEAEARERAEANRREREQQRLKSGAPVELISDYVKANIGPVPESLGVSPFYKKYTGRSRHSGHRVRQGAGRRPPRRA